MRTEVKLRIYKDGESSPNLKELLDTLEAGGWHIYSLKSDEVVNFNISRGGSPSSDRTL